MRVRGEREARPPTGESINQISSSCTSHAAVAAAHIQHRYRPSCRDQTSGPPTVHDSIVPTPKPIHTCDIEAGYQSLAQLEVLLGCMLSLQYSLPIVFCASTVGDACSKAFSRYAAALHQRQHRRCYPLHQIRHLEIKHEHRPHKSLVPSVAQLNAQSVSTSLSPTLQYD